MTTVAALQASSTTNTCRRRLFLLLHRHPHFSFKRSHLKPPPSSFNFNNPLLFPFPFKQPPISALPILQQQSQDDNNNNNNKGLKQWDSLSAKFAGAANVPFLLLQLPQILLNARNLLAGNKAALFAVPWLGMFTGLLGNLSLLSYFAKKGETEAMLVQTLGVISTYAVITQLAMAGSMPLPQFSATSLLVASGLLINFFHYFNLLNQYIWNFWEDFITVAGLSALPQVMWSTFVPYLPNSILPGIISFVIALVTVVMVTYFFLIIYVSYFH